MLRFIQTNLTKLTVSEWADLRSDFNDFFVSGAASALPTDDQTRDEHVAIQAELREHFDRVVAAAPSADIKGVAKAEFTIEYSLVTDEYADS